MYVAGDGGNDDLDAYARPGDSTFFGGTYPALTWADYMAVATKGQSVEAVRPARLCEPGEGPPSRRRPPDPSPPSEPTEEATSEPTATKTPTPADRRPHSRNRPDRRRRLSTTPKTTSQPSQSAVVPAGVRLPAADG